jgi:hypothetical protein
MRRASPAIAACVTAAIALAVYLPRQPRTLALHGDSADVITAAAVWGVPHAPGYPLFTLVGHLFTRLPWLEVAHRVHLTSALFHAAAAAVVAAAVARVTRSLVGAVAAGLSLAFARAFLFGSLVAEVLPLGDLFLALVLWLGVEVHLRAGEPRGARWILALLATVGLALAHHQMIVLLLPAALVLAGPEIARWVRARKARALAVVLVPAATYVASYALVPLAASREPPVSWGDVHDAGGLARLALRRDYGGPLKPNKKAVIGTTSERILFWGQLVLESVGPLGIAVIAAGGLGVRRRARRPALAAIVGAIGTGPVFYWLGTLPEGFEASIAMSARFVTASLVPMALLAGCGLGRLDALLARTRFGALRFGVLALPAAMLHAQRDVDLRASRRGIAFAHDLVHATEDDALVLVRGDHATQAAEYVCHVERTCGRRIVIAPGQLFMPWKNAQVRRAYPDLAIDPPESASSRHTLGLVERELRRRPVYMLPELLLRDPDIGERYPILPHGLLVRVYPDEAAMVRDSGRFLDGARALADGRCEGCSIRASELIHPSFEAQIVDMYAAALRNHALFVRKIGQGPELAQRLFDRLRQVDDADFKALDYIY